MLRSGANFQVSDERDRIYGALGPLTSPSIRFYVRLPASLETLSTFPIDYWKSVSEVYQDLIKFLINTTKTLQVLDVFANRRHLKTRQLPSWVTDWSYKWQQFDLCELDGKRSEMTPPMQQKYTDFGKLRLKGMRVPASFSLLDGLKRVYAWGKTVDIHRLTFEQNIHEPCPFEEWSSATRHPKIELVKLPYSIVFYTHSGGIRSSEDAPQYTKTQ